MAPKDTDSETVDGPNKRSAASASEMTAAATTTDNTRRNRRFLSIGLLAVLGPLAALLLGFYIYLSGGRYISTDNAYIKSAKIAVSADISGRVITVAVQENQTVKPSELLFQIDPTPFRISLDRAQARLTAARQGVDALRAIYNQKRASLARAKSEVIFHRQQYDRQKGLSRKKLVSGINLDTATRNLRDAEDQVKVAEQGLAEALAKLGGDPAVPPDNHPDVREAQGARDQAALDLKNTAIRASMRGIVTNFDLQPGEYVKAGNPIFSLVGTENTWVHANYKETELTHVRVGQRAKISVDTYPDRTFKAVVAGISPATGAEFALLPPQNATGNWVKVVQRLTVRLKLVDEAGARQQRADSVPRGGPVLRAGMSTIVEIDTGHKRQLTGMFAVVADWASGLTKGLL